MTATEHHLPYFELSPMQFEELCFWLLEALGHTDAEHWGAAGAEKGVDLISFAPDGKRWVTQCKRVRSFGKADALEEVRKVLDEPPTPAPEVYFLVATCPISRQVKEALEERIAGAFELKTWDLSKLDKRVRDHPEVVKRFFGEPAKAEVPHWNVPNRNPYFTGRQELLEALAGRLEAAGEAALTQAITGLGGVGKTQTAIEFAHRHRKRYRGGVYWADASSAQALHGSYAGFAVARGLARPDEPVEEASNRFRRRLSAQDGWLLVLDNADVPREVRALLPQTTTGHVIVTTRARVPVLGREPLPVDLLPREQAEAFLLERAGRGEDERGAAGELARALGRLPLALEQAGAYLAHHPVSISDYLDSFAQRRLELVEQYGPEAVEYQATVATTWEISFRKVEDASAAAAEALRACAFLAPDAIPLELFVPLAPLEGDVGASSHLGSALGALAVAAAGDRLIVHEQLVEPLTRYSLVSCQERGGGLLAMHRLVQEVILYGLGAGGREEVYKRVHLTLDACFPKDTEAPASWAAGTLWVPHIMSLLARWREATQEPDFDPTHLWTRAAHHAYATGRAGVTKALEEEALAIRRRELGGEHPDTLDSMNNLALALRVLGNASGAQELHEEVLSAHRSTLGEEDPRTLTSMNNLAVTLRDLDDMLEARALLEEALAARQRVLGEEHPDTLNSMNNLATILGDLGDAANARELHKKVLVVRKRVQGGEHPSTLTSMNNLAGILRGLGEASEVRELLEEVLAARRRVLGEEHLDTLASMHNLCCVLEDGTGMEVDQEMVKALLEGVRRLPEGTPIRAAAEKRWGRSGSDDRH